MVLEIKPKYGPSIRRGLIAWLFLGLGLTTLVAFSWWKWKHHVASAPIQLAGQPSEQAPLFNPHDKPMTIVLKGWDIESGRVVGFKTVIHQSKNRYNQIKQAVLAFLHGPRQGKIQVPVPEGMELNQLYLTPEGLAAVDLSMDGVQDDAFGFFEEVLFVRTLIGSLSSNFFEVKQVKILVDGKDAPLLAGHYALGTSEVNLPPAASKPKVPTNIP